MPAYDFDLIVIGGGPAGLVASKLAQGLGKKVALIDRTRLGGACTLTGCVPSKTLIHLAKTAHHSMELKKFNASIDLGKLDTRAIMAYVQSVIEDIAGGHSPEKLKALGITLFKGEAHFIDQNRVQVNKTVLSAKKFIIATGSRPFVPPIEGLDTVPYLTNESFFTQERLPSSLLILGGGPIGVEMACLHRLGTTCTIVEMNDRLLPKEDAELVQLLTAKMQQEGITLKTSLKAIKASKEADAIVLECLDTHNMRVSLKAEALLIAVGRKPDIETLGIENAGILSSRKGIIVDATLQTAAKNIYACGDVVGPYQFSHMAEYQAVIAVRNSFFPFKQKVDYTDRVWVTFSDPELATSGMTEQEARLKYGDSIIIYRKKYKECDRPRIDGESVGLAKVICDKKGYIIGAHILGARAGELIGEIQLGTVYNLKFSDFYKVIHPYPTYSDVIWQSSKRAYIDRIERNPFLKFLRFFMRFKKGV